MGGKKKDRRGQQPDRRVDLNCVFSPLRWPSSWKKIVWVCFVSGLVKQPVKRKYKNWGKNFFFFLKTELIFKRNRMKGPLF
jgi:hypothetical protein